MTDEVCGKNREKRQCLLLGMYRNSNVSSVKFIYSEKATIFLRNLHRRFVLCSNGQIYGGDFAKFFGLLRIYEYMNFKMYIGIVMKS